jgi:hypothetical protein
MAGRRPTVAAALLTGLLLLLPGHVAGTAAVFTDAATTTTGDVGASTVFVPAAANPVTCGTSGAGLNPASTITFTTPTVTAPPRGIVEYVVRVYRTDTNALVGSYLMTVSGNTATLSLDGGGLTLLLNVTYQARFTTRLLGSTRESSPARTRLFTNSGVLIANFTCGTGT